MHFMSESRYKITTAMPRQIKLEHGDGGERFSAMPGQIKLENGDGGERFSAMPG